MKAKQARRLKEQRTAYATRSAKPRTPSQVLFPQARFLTHKERVALKAYQDYLLAALPDQIERIVLFGSKARGDSARDSDVDLLVVVSGHDSALVPSGARWKELVAGAHTVDMQLGVHISPIVRPLDYVQTWTPLLDHIHEEGIELWRRPGIQVAAWPQGGEAAMALNKQEHIEARMVIAREKLSSARDLQEKGHHNDAISRAYYAMFYASKALLLALGEDPHKHEGVVSLYGERIAKVGLTDSKYGTLLRDAKDLREDADYEDFFRATKEQAENAIRNAEDFVNEAETILRRIQTRGK